MDPNPGRPASRRVGDKHLWILLAVLMALNQVQTSTSTCVSFPSEESLVASCPSSTLSLNCSQSLTIDKHNVTSDDFIIGGSSTTPTTNAYAACQLSEACDNNNECEVVDSVLAHHIPSICPSTCYYLEIPHTDCDGMMTTVFLVQLSADKTKVHLERFTSAADVADVTVNENCKGRTTSAETSESCEVPVDADCAGTTTLDFPPNSTIGGTLESVDGTAKISFAVQSLTFMEEGVKVLAAVIKPPDESEQTVELNEAPSDKKQEIDSIVIDIVFIDDTGNVKELKDGEHIDIVFQTKTSLESQKPNTERLCSFYNESIITADGNGAWSTLGCFPANSNDTHVTCRCNHTTSFAVLLQFTDCLITGANLQAQDILTKLLSSISIACLVLTIVIFVSLKLWNSDQVKAHISLALALALAQLVLFFTDRTSNRVVCMSIAGLLHYLLTVYLVCMVQEGVLLFRKASRSHKAPVKGWVLALTGWGSPIVLIAILMGSVPSGYGSDCVCWLNIKYGTMWIFAASVLVVVIVNTILLYHIMRTFVSLKANAKKSEVDRLKATIRAVLVMVPLLGMTWVFGILQAVMADTFMQYLFIVLNSLQGPLILVFQCIMHPEVQKAIERKRGKIGDSSKWAHSTSGTHSSISEKKSTQITETKFETKG